MTFYQRAFGIPGKSVAFSPVLCRLLARVKPHGSPLTNEEIALRSGLSLWQVANICRQTNWDGIDLPTMQAYLEGCNVDFEEGKQMNRIDAYLKNPKWKHLKRAPDYETFYLPLIATWMKSL